MSYLTYIKEKLRVVDDDEILDKAILFIGGNQPKANFTKKGYQIVDEWLFNVQKKWKIEFRKLNLTQSSFLGNIEPKQGGFIINLNKNLFTTQRRFTIAHEIAHLLSYKTENEWPEYDVTHSRIEEEFCDRFARAVLLPKTLINFQQFDLNQVTQTQITQLKELWPEFQVSPWQIIKRLLDEHNNSSIVAIQWEFFPDEDCFKIIEHHNPKGTFIPKHDRAFIDTMFRKKKTNFAQEAAFRNDFYEGVDTIEIGSFYKKNLHTTAFSVATTHATFIIQLIKINQNSNL